MVQQRQGSSRNDWVSLTLEAYKNGSYHSLEEARQLLGYADERSLRKPIKSLGVVLYANPLNRNFALISHQDLEAVAAYTHRRLADDAPRVKPVSDASVVRELADLQVQYAREVSDLERRLALAEEQRAQDAEAYEHRIAAMQEQHDRNVTQLRETIKNLRDKLRSVTRGKRGEASHISKERKGTIPRLPLGYEPLEAFTRLHHVDPQSLDAAIAAGSLSVVQGAWRQGKAIISQALDPAGQTAFYQVFHSQMNFQPCARCQLDQHGCGASPHETS